MAKDDEQLKNIFGRTERPAKPSQPPADNSDLDEGRIQATGVGLRTGEVDALDTIAAEHGLTRNQLMRWVVRHFLVEYRAGRIDLSGAVKPPKPGKNTLDLPK